MSSVLLLFTLATLAAMLLSYTVGFRRGKAAGWCDKYFADVAKDRARRNKLGQFRSTGFRSSGNCASINAERMLRDHGFSRKDIL